MTTAAVKQDPYFSIVPDWFVEFAKPFGIHTVYDCGSRHALDGLRLLDALRADALHIFECNPKAIETCTANIRAHARREAVTLCPCALSDKKGTVEFHPIDAAATETPWADGNLGASSMFLANPEYRAERYVQTTIKVPCTTIDTYVDEGHAPPDLLWMDLQGAELAALVGAERTLPKVKVIHVEASFKPLYVGQPLFWDVDHFLKKRGFELRYVRQLKAWLTPPRWLASLERCPWQVDAVYSR